MSGTQLRYGPTRSCSSRRSSWAACSVLPTYARAVPRPVLTWRMPLPAYSRAMPFLVLNYMILPAYARATPCPVLTDACSPRLFVWPHRR
eukprot:189174-Rhodomonas_salina.1